MSVVEPTQRGGIGVVLAIVALDFAGIGLTLPIIPRLLSDVAHTTDLGWRFGAFLESVRTHAIRLFADIGNLERSSR